MYWYCSRKHRLCLDADGVGLRWLGDGPVMRAYAQSAMNKPSAESQTVMLRELRL